MLQWFKRNATPAPREQLVETKHQALPSEEKLERLLERRTYLLGDAPSLADITAGTSLYRYFELELERPPLPQVERWYRTLAQRAAFRDHVMIPFEELRGRLLDQ